MGTPMNQTEMEHEKTITYQYRGQVERGARYRWADGYSETTTTVGVLYPWLTKKECRRDAKAQGKRAVFTV